MDFTVAFQTRLLALFYVDKDFFLASKDSVKPEYFNSLLFQWLFTKLEEYFNLYKSLPTRMVVEEERAKNKDLTVLVEEEELYREFLALITAGFLNDASYIKQSFTKFIRSRKIDSLLHEHADEAVDNGDLDALSSALREANLEFISKDKKHPDDKVFSILNLEEIYGAGAGMKTSIGLIDQVIGGLRKKELSLILGDANVGKSLLAQYIGGQVVRQYKRVLHTTHEMSRARTLLRYYANLSEPEDDISYGQLENVSPEDKVLAYLERLQEKYEGYLQVEEFPSGACTVESIYRLLDTYPDTDLLIVDYLDLLKPSRKRKELRHEISDITTELRALATNANIHVSTPTQANRIAANRRIPGKEHASEDYGKVRIADWGIAIGQNKTDIQQHQVVLSIPRSRNSSKDKAERYLIDFSHMKFKYMGEENQSGSDGSSSN